MRSEMIAPGFSRILRSSVAGPALERLAVELLHGLRCANGLAIFPRECREEIDHFKLGLRITRLDADGRRNRAWL